MVKRIHPQGPTHVTYDDFSLTLQSDASMVAERIHSNVTALMLLLVNFLCSHVLLIRS